MATVVTIQMYSGVPNPTFELTPEQEEKLGLAINQRDQKTLQQSPSSMGMLGYRGFEISSTKEETLPHKSLIFDGIVDVGESDEPNFIDSDSNIESMLLEFATPLIDAEEKEHIEGVIEKNVSGGIANSIKTFQLMAVPPLNLGKWNNDPHVKRNNNCYNYANDKITNTFAQPGRGSGQIGAYPPTCQNTGSAAERDCQVPISSATSTPSEGHFVALVIWPGRDYHWYRLDSNARWSHKPGQTAARNTDNGGNLISDPQSCDRGPYTVWCGYYHSVPANTRII
jgi:hypothetical protein